MNCNSKCEVLLNEKLGQKVGGVTPKSSNNEVLIDLETCVELLKLISYYTFTNIGHYYGLSILTKYEIDFRFVYT